MPHDPARVEDTKGWLARADDDLKAAEHLLKPSPPHLRSALFHCQQAAEKALKAFLAWHDVPFSKTHDIEQIGEACIALDASLRRSVDRAVPLTSEDFNDHDAFETLSWRAGSYVPPEAAAAPHDSAVAALLLAARPFRSSCRSDIGGVTDV